MPEVKEAAAIELRTVEVTVPLEGRTRTVDVICEECRSVDVMVEVDDYAPMDSVFEDLRKFGIDTGRPMWLHVDEVARLVTARQEPWTA